MSMKAKQTNKFKNIILIILLLIFISLFITSSYKVINWLVEKKHTKEVIEDINELVTITNVDNNEEILDNINNNTNENIINYYYDYLNVPYIDVEFKELLNINPDTVGWIKVLGTVINYPFVQTNDNDYYLTHSFDKTFNSSGWIFLDYRNDINNLDKNTIIYAHGGNRNTMFGPLKELYNNKNWFNDSNNHYIKLSTNNYNSVYKIFSLYVINTTSDYLYIDFNSDDIYYDFLSKLKERSYYDFQTDLNINDKIITLSTCYNKKEKLVIHAKLIKQENTN